jgi:hypothetical protein
MKRAPAEIRLTAFLALNEKLKKTFSASSISKL